MQSIRKFPSSTVRAHVLRKEGLRQIGRQDTIHCSSQSACSKERRTETPKTYVLMFISLTCQSACSKERRTETLRLVKVIELTYSSQSACSKERRTETLLQPRSPQSFRVRAHVLRKEGLRLLGQCIITRIKHFVRAHVLRKEGLRLDHRSTTILSVVVRAHVLRKEGLRLSGFRSLQKGGTCQSACSKERRTET